MSEKGAGNVSLHNVAERAGLNVALVRYHFGNKDRLLQAALEYITAEWRTTIENSIPLTDDPVKKIEARMRASMRVLSRYPYLTRLIVQQMSSDDSEEFKNFIDEFAGKNLAQHFQVLADGKEKGSFRDVDASLFFFSYIGISEFFFMAPEMVKRLLNVNEVEPALIARFADHAVDLILNGLVVRESEIK